MFRLGNKIPVIVSCALLAVAAVAPAAALAQQESAAVIALTPDQQALSDALMAGGEVLAEARAFYEARNFRPFWTGDAPGDFALALTTALNGAGRHGLPVARYNGEVIAAALASASDPATRAEAEVMATSAYLLYARDLTSGLLEPREIDKEIAVRPHRPEVIDLLARVVSAGNGTELFSGLVPQHPEYQVLLAEKARLEQSLAVAALVPAVEEGAVLHPGDTGPRIAQMRARLMAIGFTQGLGTSEIYDDALAGVVKLFQEQNGLTADAVAGPRTLAVMNRSDRDRLEQVLVNLERERWFNFARGRRHIEVNIPAFVAQVIDDGAVVFETKTVVGKRENRTPEFSDMMTHLVANPSWNVPQSIIAKEYLPQLQANNEAMNRQGIQIFYKGRQIDPTRVDFSQFNSHWFPVTMRQPPGAGNALGKVKFLFPNEFDIYLHDTPSKGLFDRDSRAFSHGCVRVARPIDLAHLLLARQTDDPEGLFAAALNSGQERTIYLDEPIPVHVTYRTVWTDSTGTLVYLEDVYGRDAEVLEALQAAGVSAGAAQG